VDWPDLLSVWQYLQGVEPVLLAVSVVETGDFGRGLSDVLDLSSNCVEQMDLSKLHRCLEVRFLENTGLKVVTHVSLLDVTAYGRNATVGAGRLWALDTASTVAWDDVRRVR